MNKIYVIHFVYSTGATVLKGFDVKYFLHTYLSICEESFSMQFLLNKCFSFYFFSQVHKHGILFVPSTLKQIIPQFEASPQN
jgi:hypothetical protein